MHVDLGEESSAWRERLTAKFSKGFADWIPMVFAVICLGIGAVGSGAAEETAASISSLKKRSAKLASEVMNAEALGEAAALCESILKEKPEDSETMILFARLCWSLGNHQKEVSEQREWFERGRDIAKRLQELYPDKPDGYYWFGVDYGEWVDRSSIFAKIGAKKIILENMNKVLELDEAYDSGGAYIVIGRINYVAPGGSYAKAIRCFERAIALGPRRTTAYLYLGELYLHEHLFEKAEKMLKKVQTIECDPRYAIEARDDRQAAQRLLKKLDKKEDRFPSQETLTGH